MVRWGTAPGRWVLAVAVLGSGIAFLEATVVNVALPRIGRDLGAGLDGLQWVLNGYLAIIEATFAPQDRARAVGAWSGLTGVSGAVGPLLGGWLVGAVSWRAIF